jgi:hypothetical protein
MSKEGDEYRRERFASSRAIYNLSGGDFQVDLFRFSGLMKRVLDMCVSTRNEEREMGLGIVWRLSREDRACRELFHYRGVMDSLIAAMKIEGVDSTKSVIPATNVVWNMSSGGASIKRDLCALPGLLEGLSQVLGQKCSETEHQNVLSALWNLGEGQVRSGRGLLL